MKMPIAYSFPVEGHISMSCNDNEALHVMYSVASP